MRRISRKSKKKHDSIVKKSTLKRKKGKNSKKKLRTKRTRTKRTRTKRTRTRTKRTRTKRMRKKRTKIQVGGTIFNIKELLSNKEGILVTNQEDVDKDTLIDRNFGFKHCVVKWKEGGNFGEWISGVIKPVGRGGPLRTFIFEISEGHKVHFSLGDVESETEEPGLSLFLDYEHHRAE